MRSVISRCVWLASGIASIITQSVAGGADDGEQHDRTEQPVGADAAGHQHDDLAVARQPAERDQDADQQRHRNGQPERRRQERDHQAQHGGPGHALGDQLLGQLDDEGDNQDERQDDQRNQERKQDFADDVAVEDAHVVGVALRSRSECPGASSSSSSLRHSISIYPLIIADDSARHAVAHAPAVLRGPRHRRAHPAVGAAARHQGLLGHGAVLREFPGVRVTFNLVPSLLVQIQAFAEERARDRHLVSASSRRRTWTASDRAFLVANGFHAPVDRMIRALSALRRAPRPPATAGLVQHRRICAICRCCTSWPGWIPTGC